MTDEVKCQPYIDWGNRQRRYINDSNNVLYLEYLEKKDEG